MGIIICSNCDWGLTYSSEFDNYYLKVSAEKSIPDSINSEDLSVIPPIPQDLYFCGKGCLRDYFNEERENES